MLGRPAFGACLPFFSYIPSVSLFLSFCNFELFSFEMPSLFVCLLFVYVVHVQKVDNGTSLHIDCVWDKIELVKLLLSSGANVDAVCTKAVRYDLSVFRNSFE